MASLYTQAADRVDLAKSAMMKLDGERTSVPCPSDKAGAPYGKSQNEINLEFEGWWARQGSNL